MEPRRLACVTVSFVLLAAACTGSASPDASDVKVEGPPEVRIEAVEEHARQFDEELPEREAGSQEEFAAASYITGHLQKAGYSVQLDSVPFKDLVRSTNVVALPPGGGPAAAVVTVAYDTTPSAPPLGRDLGLFLELARAARVADPEHEIGFVALAAELTVVEGGNLGTQTLIDELEDDDPKPPVITLMDVTSGGFRATGPAGERLNEIALGMDIEQGRPLSESIAPVHLRATEVFTNAGIHHAIAAGGVEEVGRVMLEYFSDLAG